MRFNCSRDKIKRGLWHRWFAWHPVRLDNGDCCWLETVERKGTRKVVCNGDFQPEEIWSWEYRA